VALFLTSAWVVLVDQITKTIVTRQIPPWDEIECLGGLLRITHVYNPGAAFGILQNKQILVHYRSCHWDGPDSVLLPEDSQAPMVDEVGNGAFARRRARKPC
jgi:hypothetical protein